jgi:hypothetical protein
MDNNQVHIKDAIVNINVENAFAFFFHALSSGVLERSFLVTVLQASDAGKLNVTGDILSYEKFIPDYSRNISKLLRFEVFFEKDIATKIVLLSNYELVSLKEVLMMCPGTYSFITDYRAEATLFKIVAVERKVKQVNAWMNNALDLADVNAVRSYGEENIRFNKIELMA